ncbi:hypothetical protein NP233_g8979 [Leucocoprinus birnbaumii]|uniref:Uncharacterized protein n=1 Tax=Leucocoprinus birnbaumii TaxID=56174 RepID=A0AAD5YNK6_9AGAR|nr:hypothetical protein NP233_g8979 [Leucocoprinus birnbaumii]
MLRATTCFRLAQKTLCSSPQPIRRLYPQKYSQAFSQPLTPPFARTISTTLRRCNTDNQTPLQKPQKFMIRENIYTIPNLLTTSRILACPVLGWSILNDDFYLATGLLVYAGLTDLVDGFLARRFKMNSVLGTILDPAADKILMTTLTITLAVQNLLPVPLAVIIIGRDVLLSLSAFYIRYTSLPHPKTFTRYWDFSIPSAEVHPTLISQYCLAAASHGSHDGPSHLTIRFRDCTTGFTVDGSYNDDLEWSLLRILEERGPHNIGTAQDQDIALSP